MSEEPIKKRKIEDMPVPAVLPPEQVNRKTKAKLGNKKARYRKAGKTTWVDPSLEEWPENDYRAHIRNLGNEVSEDFLWNAFKQYKSLQKVKVVYDKATGKSKGFGFLSFLSPDDYFKAVTRHNGTYVGSKPIEITKSNWKKRSN